MNLLYITFGDNLGVHLQAAFGMYSFLAKAKSNIQTINIITDKPLFYNHLKNDINVIDITKEELDNWQGKHRFFWRIKIKAIERICNLYPGKPVMYLDTDTFLIGDANELNHHLLAGKAFMHRNEAVLSTGRSSTEKRMWKQIKDKQFGATKMLPTDCMWNAGVVATPNNKQNKESELALAICDEMCAAGVTRRLIEQFSLTIALDRLYGLHEAKQIIAHYWTAKKLWDEKIAAFFIEAHFAAWDNEIITQKIKNFDFSNMPIDQLTRSSNVKLKKLVDKWYPTQNLEFIKS